MLSVKSLFCKISLFTFRAFAMTLFQISIFFNVPDLCLYILDQLTVTRTAVNLAIVRVALDGPLAVASATSMRQKGKEVWKKHWKDNGWTAAWDALILSMSDTDILAWASGSTGRMMFGHPGSRPCRRLVLDI